MTSPFRIANTSTHKNHRANADSRPLSSKRGGSKRGGRSSRIAISLLLAVSLVGVGLTTSAAMAQDAAAPTIAKKEVSKSYLKTVGELLRISGAEMVGQQMAYSVAQETLAAIAATGTEVTENVQKIVLDEALQGIGVKFADIDFLASLYAPFYAEHLEEKELLELLAFYQSPTGQKSLVALPAVGQSAIYALQQSSLEELPDFQAKVDEKLRKEGIVVVPE